DRRRMRTAAQRARQIANVGAAEQTEARLPWREIRILDDVVVGDPPPYDGEDQDQDACGQKKMRTDACHHCLTSTARACRECFSSRPPDPDRRDARDGVLAR